jgi:hypothetical protein
MPARLCVIDQMIPIHELRNRIRWDPEFAKGEFHWGYYDRAEDRIILVPLKEVTVERNQVRGGHSAPASSLGSCFGSTG